MRLTYNVSITHPRLIGATIVPAPAWRLL